MENVLIRDNKAGVYVGQLERFDGPTKTARLVQARHIWYWDRAAATTGIATRGIGVESKIGPTTAWIELCDVVSVIAMTDAAVARIAQVPEWTP